MKIVIKNPSDNTTVFAQHPGCKPLHLPPGASLVLQDDEIDHGIRSAIDRGLVEAHPTHPPEEWSTFQMSEYRRMPHQAGYIGDVGLNDSNHDRGIEFYEYLQERIPNKNPALFFVGGMLGYVIIEDIRSKMFHDVLVPGIAYMCKRLDPPHRLLYAVNEGPRGYTLSARMFLVWEAGGEPIQLTWDESSDWSYVTKYVPPIF